MEARPIDEEPEGVADGGKDGVVGITVAMVKVVALHAMLVVEAAIRWPCSVSLPTGCSIAGMICARCACHRDCPAAPG
jgi:hypothetical protein